jgi:ATP-dependent helicase/nuclease subunit A
METDEVEVKRQLDAEGDRIRVMTVHGAKGLEAEVVILPDTCDRKVQDWDQIHRLEDGPPVWKVAKEEAPEVLAAERAARAARDAAERLRLLYVAMTRARSWLVVCGAGKTTQADGWHNLISAGVVAAGAKALDDGTLRHSFGAWPGVVPHVKADPVPLALPAWTKAPAPEAPRQARVLSPSDLGGAKALPGEAETDAKARGSALHLLLERLPGTPPDSWPARAAALIPDPALLADALPQLQAILGEPGLSQLFGPESLAEVGVTAPWAGHRLTGSIDRLLVTPDRVLIVDFKSNALIPDRVAAIPEGILRQLGAYAHMVAQIYPDRRVETAVLWTRGPVFMPVDPEIVRQALQRTTIP